MSKRHHQVDDLDELAEQEMSPQQVFLLLP
jgi:hypothetical protein